MYFSLMMTAIATTAFVRYSLIQIMQLIQKSS